MSDPVGLWATLVCLAAALALASCAVAEPDDDHPNVPFPTLGGKQFWRDVWWREGWRVQENVFTGHYRLLDAKDVRRAWGGEEACLAKGRALAPAGVARDELVVLLHGLIRSEGSMEPLAERLRARGHHVASVGYPSTRGAIEEHAAGVEVLLSRLDPPPRRVSFVTHSLGGRVAHALLVRDGAWKRATRPARLVQLAPPNAGSSFARAARRVPGLEAFVGPALEQVAAGPEDGTVDVEVGVIAASAGHGLGYNLLLPGDDDGVVSVDETRYDGPHEHATVRGLHSFVMRREDVAELVDRFLRAGTFEEEREDG